MSKHNDNRHSKGGYPPPKQTQITVDLKTLKDIAVCKCGSSYFEQIVSYKLLPALISPNGQEQLLTILAAKCALCDLVYSMEQIIAMAREEKDDGASKLIQ